MPESDLLNTLRHVWLNHEHEFGLLAGLILIISNLPYIYSTLRGRTRPNRVSWWIWAFIGIVLFATYQQSGARENQWVLILMILTPLLIALLSLRYGVGGASRLDLVSIVGCLIALALWAVSGSAIVGLAFSILADAIAGLPTVWKSWQQPYSENLLKWSLTLLAFFLNLFAIEEWTPFQVSYPLYLLLLALVIVIAIVLGRRRVAQRT